MGGGRAWGELAPAGVTYCGRAGRLASEGCLPRPEGGSRATGRAPEHRRHAPPQSGEGPSHYTPPLTTPQVVAQVLDSSVSVEEAVGEELLRNEACLRRAAYNNRLRGTVIAKYHVRHGKREVRRARRAEAAAAAVC